MVLFLKEIQENIKLDKIDKILIALVFIIGAVFSPVFADSEINVQYVSGVGVSSGTIVENSNQTLFYYSLIKGRSYRITNTGYENSFSLRTSDSLAIGTTLTNFLSQATLPAGTSVEFTAGSDFIVSYYANTNISEFFIVEDISNEMGKTVDSLVDNIGPSAIWDIFNTGINYIYVVVLVAFGIFIISMVIRKISKGKGKI